VTAAIIAIIPVMLALAIAVWLVSRHRDAVADVLKRVSKIGVGGVFELELDTEAIKTAKPDAPVTDAQATALDQRVERAKNLVAGSRILWVDDMPSNNDLVRTYLRSADVTVVNSTTTGLAMSELSRFDYDAVITDIERPESPRAGLELLSAMRAAHFNQPVIAYVGHVDVSRGTPSGLFGITDRPEELIHLYLDALERVQTSRH